MPSTLNTDKFYTNDEGINSNHYGIVVGFLKKMTTTEKAAEAFAADLFRVSKSLNISVLTIIDSMKDKDEIGISEIMAYYLNQTRSQRALLGVKNTITPFQPVARNIII